MSTRTSVALNCSWKRSHFATTIRSVSQTTINKLLTDHLLLGLLVVGVEHEIQAEEEEDAEASTNTRPKHTIHPSHKSMEQAYRGSSQKRHQLATLPRRKAGGRRGRNSAAELQRQTPPRKTGFIEVDRVAALLNTMGQQFDHMELQQLIENVDKQGTGKLNFDSFYSIAANFLEEEDDEAMLNELKEAFRLYDKEGNGYITTTVLREILAALDDKLTSDDLDGIIEEIDEDGSGTIDFDEFMEMMTG